MYRPICCRAAPTPVVSGQCLFFLVAAVGAKTHLDQQIYNTPHACQADSIRASRRGDEDGKGVQVKQRGFEVGQQLSYDAASLLVLDALDLLEQLVRAAEILDELEIILSQDLAGRLQSFVPDAGLVVSFSVCVWELILRWKHIGSK